MDKTAQSILKNDKGFVKIIHFKRRYAIIIISTFTNTEFS